MSTSARWLAGTWPLAASLLLGCAAARAPAAATRLQRLAQAQALLRVGSAAEALPELWTLYEAEPSDTEAARLLAEAAHRAGRTDEALERLTQRTGPGVAFARALLLTARGGTSLEAAFTAFAAAVESAPRQAEIRYRYGLALLESERDAEARTQLEQAVALAPERTSWSVALARALHRTGEPRKAVAALGVAVRGALSKRELESARATMDAVADPFRGVPESARARFEEAVEATAKKDISPDAAVDLELLRQDFPDFALAHAVLGLAWARLDDPSRAIESLRTAIALAPTDGQLHAYLGLVYASRQRHQAAAEAFGEAVKHHPLLADAWFQLGSYAHERGDFTAAQAHLEIATRLAPSTDAYREKLATVYAARRDWVAAERELKTLLEANPDEPGYTLRLGLTLADRAKSLPPGPERSDCLARARAALGRVLERQPDNAFASKVLSALPQR